MQPVKKESKLLATLSVFCRWHMFESAVGRQTLGELFAYYQQSDEWGKPAQGSGLLDYFVSMADRHNVPADTTAAVKSCLLTVFQYADCLQSIKQYAFAASQPDSAHLRQRYCTGWTRSAGMMHCIYTKLAYIYATT